MSLTPGSNLVVPTQALCVRILAGAPVDVSAFRLFANGRVRGDPDMVFYGQPDNDDNTISLANEGNNTSFAVDLNRLKPDVQKVAFTATCEGNQTIAGLRRLAIQVEAGQEVLANGAVDLAGREEAALIMGELYRRNREWKFRFVAQGFNGGLKPLAEHFGVEIEDTPAPAPPAPDSPPLSRPPPESEVNLSKVSLTKEKPAISLEKRESFGQIRINLNWHREQSSPGLLDSLLGNKGVDLDLAAFVELQNGNKSLIQALGRSFGSYRHEPYIALQGDDRTGETAGGEWMYINGDEWKNIRQVLIYTFIYEGVPSWDKTDGVVTLYAPGQPPIETRLTEGDNRRRLCAIARLMNESGSIRAERINRFFKHQKEMDEAFGWGFRWKAGAK